MPLTCACHEWDGEGVGHYPPPDAALRHALWDRLPAAGAAPETAVALASAAHGWIAGGSVPAPQPPPAEAAEVGVVEVGVVEAPPPEVARSVRPDALEVVEAMLAAGERVTSASLAARPGLWCMDNEHGLTWRQVVGRTNSLRVTARPPLPPFLLATVDPPTGASGCSLEGV